MTHSLTGQNAVIYGVGDSLGGAVDFRQRLDFEGPSGLDRGDGASS